MYYKNLPKNNFKLSKISGALLIAIMLVVISPERNWYMAVQGKEDSAQVSRQQDMAH